MPVIIVRALLDSRNLAMELNHQLSTKSDQ